MRRSELSVSILLSIALIVTGVQVVRIWTDSMADLVPTLADAGVAAAPVPEAAPIPDALDRIEPSGRAQARLPDFLPPEAEPVLAAIDRGGPFAYEKDGSTFQNREGLLPPRPRGYYREYTVETPGSRDRGARRIITGGSPPTDYFYTDDHYASFRAFAWGPAR